MKKIRDKQSNCLNCLAPIPSDANYCHICGQENCSRKIPVMKLVIGAVEDYFSFDSKFFKSFIPLIFKPGFLTNEFIIGRRVRYIPAFRMYLIISVLYFFLLSLNDDPLLKFNNNSGNGLSLEAGNTQDTSKASGMGISFSANGEEVKYDDIATLRNEIETMGEETLLDSLNAEEPFERMMISQLFKMVKRSESVYDYFLRKLSIMIFFLMPVMALLLKLFFRKNNLYYLEHLVFSFHLHSFIFLLLSFYLLVNMYLVEASMLIALLILYLYTVVSLKKVYCNSTGLTIVKSLFLIGTYNLVALVFLVVTLFISLILF